MCVWLRGRTSSFRAKSVCNSCKSLFKVSKLGLRYIFLHATQNKAPGIKRFQSGAGQTLHSQHPHAETLCEICYRKSPKQLQEPVSTSFTCRLSHHFSADNFSSANANDQMNSCYLNEGGRVFPSRIKTGGGVLFKYLVLFYNIYPEWSSSSRSDPPH